MIKYILKYKVLSVICILTTLVSCNDDFLEKIPETSLTQEGFFNTPKDLEAYVNGLYTYDIMYPRNTYDNEPFSDNIASRNDLGSNEYMMLKGDRLSADNAGGWSNWDKLRAVNVMLSNSDKPTGDQAEINHFLGIGRYFRAMCYIDWLFKYSDVPWINKPLSSDDDDIYKAADPRTLVADSIKADLEFAAVNIKPDLGRRSIISSYAAQFLLARFCLYEGTWRKYHDELKLSGSANSFLERAVSATEQIMNSGIFSITGKGRDGFSALFTSADLSDNAEIILMTEYIDGKGDGNSSFHALYGDYALSRSLQETFLMKDGSRFTDQPGYDKKEYKDVFTNRDPRLLETLIPPGFVQAKSTTPYVINLKHGGYEAIKYYPRDLTTLGGDTWRKCWNDLPLYRYAEILLIYAEAKAELGTLTQADLDKSINLIRSRVDMPSLNLAVANNSIDPVLSAQYPNVDGANKGIILEIRRERRVELALEGQRLNDLNRWACGELIAQAPQGIYIPQLGPLDVTGDGVPDVAVVPSESDANGLIPYVVNQPNSIYLSEGTSGFIMFDGDRTVPRIWKSPKFYYRPIPTAQIQLNQNLKQVHGW